MVVLCVLMMAQVCLCLVLVMLRFLSPLGRFICLIYYMFLVFLHFYYLFNDLHPIIVFFLYSFTCLFFFFFVKDLATKAVLFSGNSLEGLYMFPLSRSALTTLQSACASPAVWHNRLGHPHRWVLSHILKNCLVSESSSVDLSSLCGAGQLGKSSRFPLSRVVSSSSHVLDLVYIDIWGPDSFCFVYWLLLLFLCGSFLPFCLVLSYAFKV